MQSNDFRRFYHYDFFLKSSSKYASWNIELRDVLPLLQQSIAAGDNYHDYEGGRVRLIVRDIVYFKEETIADEEVVSPVESIEEAEFAALLIGMTDQKAQHKTFTNMATLKQRSEGPKSDESAEVCCHIIFKLEPLDETKLRYYALLEGVTGLGRSRVLLLLNKIINEEHKNSKNGLFQGEDLRKAKTLKSKSSLGYRPIMELRSYASVDFKEKLASGSFMGMNLVKHKVESPIGQKSYLSAKTQKLQVEVDKKELSKFKGNVWEDVRVSFGDLENDWDAVEFQIRSDDGRKVLVNYDLDTENFTQKEFVRSSSISGIQPELRDGAESVVEHLCSKMIKARDNC